MGTRPLLIFPLPQAAPRQKLSSFGALPVLPTFEQQRGRVSPKLLELQRAFRARRAVLRQTIQGDNPELVLVIETVGSVDNFLAAVRHTKGLEWLAEWDEEGIPPDDFFYRRPEDRTSPIAGRVYLVMSNQAALLQLLHLWNRFRRDPYQKFDRGLASWKQIFNQLRNIRLWDARDRLLETGVMEDWRERVSTAQVVPFEVEFWFRHSADARSRSSARLRQLVTQSQGSITQETVIEEIEYHGAVGRLPRAEVENILATQDTALVQCEDVMFFRPVAQFAIPLSGETPSTSVIPFVEATTSSPRVALLDGLPLQNHAALANRIIVDDPDNWAAEYPASARQHGTAMASLVIRGELETGSPVLPDPVYARPVLRPVTNPISGNTEEAMPEDQLAVDLIHRAVRRIFVGDGQNPAAAPTIRVINFSIGDRVRLFDHTISPFARLLDWLSWRYNVLFVISAGNHTGPLQLTVRRGEFATLTAAQVQTAVLDYLTRNSHLRRLRVPAEAVNALTVAADHADASTIGTLGARVNPYERSGLPSPINPVGFGYRGSVKPDVLAPGGRQLYREKLGTTHEFAVLESQISIRPPGLLVASPGIGDGSTTSTSCACGTSGAAALTSHSAGLILGNLSALRAEPGGELLADTLDPVLVKCLLVHGCSWGDLPYLGDRELVSRLMGYGIVDVARSISCTDQRATMVGCGLLLDGEGHRFEVPLPPSLIGSTVRRLLRVTLAWQTPINPANRKYRRAAMWVEPPNGPLRVSRSEVSGKTVRNGTVQHEILVGDQASAFTDGTRMQLQVNCRQDAGNFEEAVPYALAVTIEVGAAVGLPIYTEVRDRLRVPVAVATALT